MLGAVASFGVAHASPVVPCPGRAAARGWIRGTVTSLEPASFTCTPVPGVTTDAGCVAGAIDPWCGGTPRNITISIDGVPQSVTRPANAAWQVCGLSPGQHTLTVCSLRSAFRCTAATASVVQLVEAEPRVHVRVDHVFVGTQSWAGRDLSFTLGNAQRATDLTLPPQVTLAWTEDGEVPHAYLCEPPRSGAPGCARCNATGDPEQAAWLLAVVAIAVGRRR